MTQITEALEAFIPTLADRFVAQSNRLFNQYVEKYGPALRGIVNSYDYRAYKNMVSPFITRVGVGSINDPVALNTDRLNTLAVEYAKATVAAWEAKISAKLGELEGAELIRGAGNTFTLTGTKGGRRVRIEQDMIVNVSSQGTLFNQFPARIYVDGKFTPAAKFAAL